MSDLFSFCFVQEEFIPIEELATGNGAAKLKQKKDDCLERITDNRKTHFQFGSDNKHKHTEQVIKFYTHENITLCLPQNSNKMLLGNVYMSK